MQFSTASQPVSVGERISWKSVTFWMTTLVIEAPR
jgi:hypothetical protein